MPVLQSPCMEREADFWIERLALVAHPEGGYYRETYRSSELMPASALPARFEQERSFSTAIYFLLKDAQVSVFHRLHSDEVWHFYEGSPLALYLLDSSSGRLDAVLLGRDVARGQALSYVVPAGVWVAAEVSVPSSYSLIGCTAAPGFIFADLVFAAHDELRRINPRCAEDLKRLIKVKR